MTLKEPRPARAPAAEIDHGNDDARQRSAWPETCVILLLCGGLGCTLHRLFLQVGWQLVGFLPPRRNIAMSQKQASLL